MRTKLFAAVAIALGATATLTTSVHATTSQECQGLIADLSGATVAAGFTSNKSRDGLVAKADAAASKLDVGKVEDAFGKLIDYDVTLDALHDATKPKVDELDYALLNGAVEAALACVAEIEAP